MSVGSIRLVSLLKEVMTPQAVPNAKADPATTALVKAVVMPKPSVTAMPTSLSRDLASVLSAAHSRGPHADAATAEVDLAYRLMAAETESEAPGTAVPAASPARIDQPERPPVALALTQQQVLPDRALVQDIRLWGFFQPFASKVFLEPTSTSNPARRHRTQDGFAERIKLRESPAFAWMLVAVLGAAALLLWLLL